ncbi:hypothetical protein [Novosphingobium sp.]|uniref:hypothetical protein n=1 Tax=Novosphingobium sp. TaxID=1874826 RepID=UPI00260E0761|nr:hypothetical protein [Novosphingobium sp.]
MVIERAAGREPLAALLFGRDDRPAADAVADLAVGPDGFSILNARQAPQGQAELLRDGLTFDLAGLAPAPKQDLPAAVHRVALSNDFNCDSLEATSFRVGPHLAGAEHLLPVLRVAAAILRHLTQLKGLQAIVWRPARIVMSPAWFAEAVGVWLAGGPFPALALTALVRNQSGIESEGLGFLTGQEFTLHARAGGPNREDSRIAVRLTDWLVTHGRVDAAREVVLAGVGAVWIEPDGGSRLNVAPR